MSLSWLTLLTLPSLAYGLNTLIESWALKTFSRTPWDKALNAAALANLLSIPTLLGAKKLLSHWDLWLPYNPLHNTLEIVLLWMAATTVANSIELLALKKLFHQPTPLGFVVTTTITNGLTALADLWESLQKSL
jgi:hypothetical protein